MLVAPVTQISVITHQKSENYRRHPLLPFCAEPESVYDNDAPTALSGPYSTHVALVRSAKHVSHGVERGGYEDGERLPKQNVYYHRGARSRYPTPVGRETMIARQGSRGLPTFVGVQVTYRPRPQRRNPTFEQA